MSAFSIADLLLACDFVEGSSEIEIQVKSVELRDMIYH